MQKLIFHVVQYMTASEWTLTHKSFKISYIFLEAIQSYSVNTLFIHVFWTLTWYNFTKITK